MNSPRRRASWVALLSLWLVACGSDSGVPTDSQAGDSASVDTADSTVGETRPPETADDTGDTHDAQDSVVEPGPPLVLAHDGATLPLPVAHFGISIDRQDGDEQPTLYVEAADLASGVCPSQTSPTPGHLLILSGLPLPASDTPLDQDDGLKAVLLDFEGDLLVGEQAFLQAARVTLVFDDGLVCTDCFEQGPPSQPEGFATLTVNAEFEDEDGTVFITAAGQLTATHCDSLDNPD